MDDRHFGAKLGSRFGRGMLDAQCNAHGRCDTDRRRAANHHFADGFGDIVIVRVGVTDFFRREAPLVQHDYPRFRPSDWLRYVHTVFNLVICGHAVSLPRPLQ